MTELTFTKVGRHYESDAVEVGGDFAIHVESDNTNTIEILRSATGEDHVKCWRADAGPHFDMTYTGAVNGLSIIVRCKELPLAAGITW